MKLMLKHVVFNPCMGLGLVKLLHGAIKDNSKELTWHHLESAVLKATDPTARALTKGLAWFQLGILGFLCFPWCSLFLFAVIQLLPITTSFAICFNTYS